MKPMRLKYQYATGRTFILLDDVVTALRTQALEEKDANVRFTLKDFAERFEDLCR